MGLKHRGPGRIPMRHALALASLACACGLAPAAAAAPSPGAVPAAKEVDRVSFYANFAGMQLQDQDGRRFTPAHLGGRIVLANFVFTGCSTACPVQTRALAELQRQLPPELRKKVHLLSISVDPLNDTPQALKQFAKSMAADLDGWSFVTGKPDQVDSLADRLRLFRTGAEAKRPDDHNTALWLIDAKGNLRMRYNGNLPDVPRLLREIKLVSTLQ